MEELLETKYLIHWGVSLVGKLGARYSALAESALAECLATLESDTVQNTGFCLCVTHSHLPASMQKKKKIFCTKGS